MPVQRAGVASWAAQPIARVGASLSGKAHPYGHPVSAGGATDLLGRLVGIKLGERIGQTVVSENRTGGGGNIGADYTAKAPADGYTIMVGGIPHSINMSLYKKVPTTSPPT